MSTLSSVIPADVWFEIVKNITVRQDVHNLSLTCRATRDATLPLLFRTLSFDASRHPKTAWQSYLFDSSQRAESLLRHPHLLFHVLEVHLSLRKSVRGTLWRSTSDKISTTISASPRIRKLSLESCIITPSLHEVIYGKPSLQSLEVHHIGVSPLLRPRPVVGLTGLSYRCSRDVPPSWFIQLLDCCLSTLISLTVDDEEVFTHFVSNSGRQPLALRTLDVFGHFLENGHRDIWNVSIMCPELRTLRLAPFVDFTFPVHALPKLEFVEGPLRTLCALIPGRSIHTVNLTDYTQLISLTYLISLGDVTLLRAGRVPVRHLTITTCVSFEDGPIKLLVAAFGDLLSLSLATMHYSRPWANFEASLDALTDSLSQWSQLEVYRIFPNEAFNPDLSQKYSQFPIAPSGDPFNRGHPSLIEFQFVSNLVWLWFPGEGWTLREVNGPQYLLHS